MRSPPTAPASRRPRRRSKRCVPAFGVMLNRRGIANDTTIQPDAMISNLHQLPDLIG